MVSHHAGSTHSYSTCTLKVKPPFNLQVPSAFCKYVGWFVSTTVSPCKTNAHASVVPHPERLLQSPSLTLRHASLMQCWLNHDVNSNVQRKNFCMRHTVTLNYSLRRPGPLSYVANTVHSQTPGDPSQCNAAKSIQMLEAGRKHCFNS